VTCHAALHYGWEVVGICRSTHGLLQRPPEIMPLSPNDMYSLLIMGGTILGTTNKGDPFAFTMPDGRVCDRSNEIIENYRDLKLDALIGIGGDGSLAILRKLAQQGGINLVAVPKTIDNDLGITEHCIGADTAINIATEALDRLHFTAASHSRVMILEVMGRDAGHIAISSGIAGGADIILIPEIPYTIANICNAIKQLHEQGRNFCLIVVAEAVCSEDGRHIKQVNRLGESRLGGIGQYLADEIAECTRADVRVTTLGHVQRGGTPSPLDRVVASAFGIAAVDLIAQEQYDRMVCWQGRQVVSVPITEAIAQYSAVELQGTLVKTARGLGICLGDEGKDSWLCQG